MRQIETSRQTLVEATRRQDFRHASGFFVSVANEASKALDASFLAGDIDPATYLAELRKVFPPRPAGPPEPQVVTQGIGATVSENKAASEPRKP